MNGWEILYELLTYYPDRPQIAIRKDFITYMDCNPLILFDHLNEPYIIVNVALWDNIMNEITREVLGYEARKLRYAK
jgi:hypothetical protein